MVSPVRENSGTSAKHCAMPMPTADGHDNAARYVNLQLAVKGDVEHELSDHHAMLAYARLRDVERGVDILRRHVARVSRELLTSLSGEVGRGSKHIV